MSEVTIITRTLNRPVLLRRMLESVLAQSFSEWRLMILNSGDTRSVEALLAEHSGRIGGRVTHLPFVNPSPGMRGIPLNEGVRRSKGRFITVLDDDDTWSPRFLQVMVGALNHKPHANVRGAVCRTSVIEEAPVASGLGSIRSYEMNDELCNVTLPALAVVNRFCIHSFVYERSALATVGMYPEDYPVLEDWHFNLRFVRHHEIVVVPEVLANYHIRPAEAGGAGANSQVAEKPDHKFHEARLINEALREDLDTATPGLGQVLAQAVLARELNDTLHRHESRMKTISDKVGKTDNRTKELKDKLIPGRH